MPDTADVHRFADAVMAMIEEDQASGQIPRDVASLDELDNCVDAGDYYRRADMPSDNHEATELRNAVSAEIDRRLAGSQGGPWHVRWSRSGGAQAEVGAAVGYATRTNAEAVGHEHVAAHGGSFYVLNTNATSPAGS